MDDPLAKQFATLLERSSSLLHRARVDAAGWKAVVNPPESEANSAPPSSNPRGNVDDDSDSDDDMMMLGGGLLDSDSDDDENGGLMGGFGMDDGSDDGAADAKDAVVDGEDDWDEVEEGEEEEAALFKRASSVHAALLLSLPSEDVGDGGRETVKRLVSGIISGDTSSPLVSLLSYVTSSSCVTDSKRMPKKFAKNPEKWKRVCFTNSLLAVQYLLHVMKQGGDSCDNGGALEEWNAVVLPLLFASTVSPAAPSSSLFMTNDALRDALLDLTPLARSLRESVGSGAAEKQCRDAASSCLSALHRATSSSSSSSTSQKQIAVASQVLIRLHDAIEGGNATLIGVVRDAMHEAVLRVVRGICYQEESSPSKQLSLESLRPVTGMLLPKLYREEAEPTGRKDIAKVSSSADERAVELWNEIMLLLSSAAENAAPGRKRCKNWDQVAPMTATSMLCILLPTLRALDLPVSPDSATEACRPIYNASVWTLLRECLGRTGDSEIGEGANSGGRGTSLLSRGARDGGGEAGDNEELLFGDHDLASMDQLLRRRSAHMLRLMVEHERDIMLRESRARNSNGGKKKKKKGQQQQQQQTEQRKSDAANSNADINRHRVDLWTKYVLCFEMLEMEMELHLVEQVWPTVKEMCSELVGGDLSPNEESTTQLLPTMSWGDIASLLCRVLLSEAPTMRKLGLYRLLSGHAGVDVTIPSDDNAPGDMNEETEEDATNSGGVFMKPKQGKGKIKKSSGGALDENILSAPLSIVSVDFVLDVVMRSYDSIVGTKIGQNMQIEEENGRQESVSIADLVSEFLSKYTATLSSSDDGGRLSEFVNRVFGPELIQSRKSRSLVLFYRAVTTALDSITSSTGEKVLHASADTLLGTIRAMRAIFSSGGAPKSMQEALKLYVALLLKSSVPWEKVDASVVLQILALYPPPEQGEESDRESAHAKSRDALGTWLLGLGDGKWAQSASSTCASAFVLGQLLPFGEMDVMSGVNMAEREMGMALCVMCSLTGNGSELLWPAVFKGLQSVPPTAASTPGFCKANRSMILLEFGCREGTVSGMGNGDLVLDSKEFMMPPPPHIEALLGNAVQFILSQLVTLSSTLFETVKSKGASGGSTRSSTTGSTSAYTAILIGQLRVLHLSYPSSASLSQAVNKMLEECVGSLARIANAQDEKSGSEQQVKYLTLSYAALSCGAAFTGDAANELLSTCRSILSLELSIPAGIKKEAKQACRSIFTYAKWGSLSLIVPKIMEEAGLPTSEVEDVYQSILNCAKESVDATPVVALPPLFECALGAGRHIVTFDGQKYPLISSLQSIIETLFAVLKEEIMSNHWSYMLNEVCSLIFRGKLLLEEYNLSYSSEPRGPMPIKQAFEDLLKLGGTSKPHIFKTAVSRLSVAWLGPEGHTDVGICAIPYRDRIVDLLVYKEAKFDESSAHQVEGGGGGKWDGLPGSTNESSITRAFVLSFLSKLPSPGDMSDLVLKELVHVIIKKLTDICCTKPAKGKAFITGSEEYALMTRSWQALCLLSRFVTEDIASGIAARVYPAMGYTLHGQIRYFMEVFTIRCIRLHPSIFGQKLIEEMGKYDLSLQQVSSLMIIGGNISCGRYSSDFFRSATDKRIKQILCGALPWLSSTQGFSRAIAQLLCHKLIPLVVDVETDAPSLGEEEKDAAVLRNVYSFLEKNTDMSRLRSKQQLFFDTYDVDGVCTFEGLLSIPVDEGEEASPVHMADAIKDCLAEVYKDAHGEDAPVWKQMEDILLEAGATNPNQLSEDLEDIEQDESELVNFQRKILPIDALDLGIRSFHEQKLFNAAGKKKQKLIVCATLIDKVPNLAGLARTCEIFSAQSLAMPNLLVRKQDDFKSISASANDWIDMEEVKEDELLSWLHRKRAEGYAIVGVEQTASSKCLTKMSFPEKTVLLLGKEKEGIPIEFLSAVDQCIEIPQLGIIRSLNVHVSGAITVWEYTKQMLEKK